MVLVAWKKFVLFTPFALVARSRFDFFPEKFTRNYNMSALTTYV